MIRSALVVSLLAVAALCATAEGSTGVSPHGQPDKCTSCHLDAAGNGFIGGSDVTACRACHDEEPHQVGIAPVRAHVPANFPLPDGKLGCETCHDEPSHHGKGIDPANPRFFRGGPYEHLGGLCANCHKETAGQRFNPHAAMRDPATRADACLLCHQTMPEPGEKIDALRVPSIDTCRGCHFETTHAGSAEHQIVMPPDVAARARAAGLPLTDDNRAACATCHDPHPPGATPTADLRADWDQRRIITEAWETDVLAPAQLARAGAHVAPLDTSMDMLRLPLEDGTLCRTCHLTGGPTAKAKP